MLKCNLKKCKSNGAIINVKVSSKLIIKTPERRTSGIIIVHFQEI